MRAESFDGEGWVRLMLRMLGCTTLAVLLVMLPAAGGARRAKPNFQVAGLDKERYLPDVGAFLIIVDGSASMHATTREVPKIDVAREVAKSLARSIPPLDYRGGVRSFGLERRSPDVETKLLYGMRRYASAGALQAIETIRVTDGDSPLSAALAAAARDLSGTSGETAVFVVSDGLEMGEDEVAAARRLRGSVNACIYAVQVGISSRGAALLQRVVDAGGCGRRVQAWDLADRQQMRRLVIDALLLPDSDGDGVPDPKDRCANTPTGTRVDHEGCPVMGPEISADMRRLQVLFAFDSAEIHAEYREALGRLAAELKRNPGMRLVIEGHADDSGSTEYNQQLSERRARVTRDYLVAQGVAPAQLVVQGLGESRPLVANDTRANRAKNRRIQFRPPSEPAVTSR